MNVNMLPDELASHLQGSLIDIALYTPIQMLSGDGEETSTENSRNKSDLPTVTPGSEFQLLAVDQDDGTLTVITKIKKGYGGTGSMGILNNDRDLGFIIQKGNENSSTNLVAVSMADDGSMKQLSLPPASTPLTIATDLNTGLIFELRPLEDRLVVKRQTGDGNLEKIQELSTGREPSMVYRVPLSRQILVANGGDQTVSVYTMNDDGRLTLVETIKTERPPLAITATLNGRFVYISLEKGGISRFAVGEDGNLKLLDTVETEGAWVSLVMSSNGDTMSGLLGSSRVACPTGMSCKSIAKEGTRDIGINIPEGIVESAIDFEVGQDESSDDASQEGKRQKPSRKARITIVKNGDGTGRVVSGLRGIDCGNICETRFRKGKNIDLTAIPDEGSVFGGWSRTGCPKTPYCKFDNWNSRDIVVTFNKTRPPSDKGIHWFRGSVQGKVALNVRAKTTGVWNTDGLLDGAIAQWNASSAINLTKVDGQGCNGSAGQIEVCNGNYGGSLNNGTAIGVAQVWWDTRSNHIYQAVVLLDDDYLVNGRYNDVYGIRFNTPDWRKYVICQELGHTLGLTPINEGTSIGHRDETQNNRNLGTCLDYTLKPEGGSGQPSNTQPDQEDFRQLEAIQNHSDSGNNKPTDSRFLKIKPKGAEMGRLVRSSMDGGVRVYEMDFGQGRKITTHVFSAPAKKK